MEKPDSQIVVEFPYILPVVVLNESYRDEDKIVFTIEGVSESCLSLITKLSLIGNNHSSQNNIPIKFSFPEDLDLEAVKEVAVSVSKDGVLLQGEEEREGPLLKFYRQEAGLSEAPDTEECPKLIRTLEPASVLRDAHDGTAQSTAWIVEKSIGMARRAAFLVEDCMTYPEGRDVRFSGVEAVKDGVTVDITFLLKEVEGYEELAKIVQYRKMTARKAWGIAQEWLKNLGNWIGEDEGRGKRKGKKR